MSQFRFYFLLSQLIIQLEGAIQGRENRRIRFGLVIGWCSQGLLPLDGAPLTATTLGDRLNVSSFSTSISDWLTN